MKRRVLAISAQALPLRTVQPWTCRRCLAQSAVAPTVSDDFIAPPAVPQQSHDIPTPSTFAKTAVPAESHTSTLNAAASITPPKPSEISSRLKFEQRFLDKSLPPARREQRRELLTYLKRDIKHDVPAQYLTHVDPAALTEKEREQRKHLYKWAMTGHANNEGEPKQDNARQVKGVVVSAGKMDRTVKVRIPGQRWEPRIKKYYASHTDHLVHDPNNSLLEGDIVILHRLSVAKTVRHVVGAVSVPYGKPLDQRPPILTPEERLAEYKKQRFAKFARQLARRAAPASSTASNSSDTKTKTPGQQGAEKTAKLKAAIDANVREAAAKSEELHKVGLDSKSANGND